MSRPGQRATLYELAVETGFRRNELRSLTVASFKLDGDPATVTVRAGYAKNKRRDTLALSPGLASRIREHLRTKLPGAQAFNVPQRTAEMLRSDLERAGLPYVDDAGEVFDFHALRVQCATNLARGGAHPTVAQARMRHSTIKLTMDTYTRVNPGERSAAALEALPNLSTG